MTSRENQTLGSDTVSDDNDIYQIFYNVEYTIYTIFTNTSLSNKVQQSQIKYNIKVVKYPRNIHF